jgi:hypothetical protein
MKLMGTRIFGHHISGQAYARSAIIGIALLSWSVFAWSCDMTTIQPGTPENLASYFRRPGMTVLTFLGYSAAEYEDRDAMLAEAARVLDRYPTATTIVNIGATEAGIGAVYDIAKRKGYSTSGIVSSQAKKENVPLARCVDMVFYVEDDTWGGKLPNSGELSPTSRAMVDYSDVVVAIGGGDIARDELVAARAAGKRVHFVAADTNHEKAREAAREKGEPEPTDFAGAAATAF